MQNYVVIVCTLFLWGYVCADVEEDRLGRRVQAHLTIRDFSIASEEARQALILYPQSIFLHESYIRALAKLGDEKKLLQAWETYVQQFPDKSMNRELIEDMAWGVLYKASHSSSLVMRQMALLAAFFSQDAKGVTLLHRGMRDSNYALRTIAVKLAAHFRDDKLIEEVKRLFHEERVWSVRQKVLEAIGKMKILSLKPELEALIGSSETSAKEKALAIAALLELLETINRQEVERLSSSSRSGLRQLACQAVAYFQCKEDFDQLLHLVKDPQADVRFEAFQAIGQLRPDQQETVLAVARQGILDNHYHVALSAAWLLTIYAPEEGQKVLLRFLHDKRRGVRYLAAAALNAAGQYGIALSHDQFRQHPDPYIRLNLALGLIGQRESVQEAAAYVSYLLATEKEKWRTLEAGLFHAIVNLPKRKSEDPLITPEIDNQLIRLELLNLLTILKVPYTQQIVRQYLIERAWEISAVAAALLLTEGDEIAADLVEQLLQDPQPRVRLQAALILSLWSREESAIRVLEESYFESEWEFKARILEGLGRIGSTHSVPFLLKVLKEPSQTLRLIAAMALIQCLNH